MIASFSDVLSTTINPSLKVSIAAEISTITFSKSALFAELSIANLAPAIASTNALLVAASTLPGLSPTETLSTSD